jgi:tetratricopeptide (TPR) repeat protein
MTNSKFKKIVSILSILFLSNIYSQNSCNFSKEDYNLLMCLENYSGYTSSIKSQSLVSEILKKVGIVDANFILKTCNDSKNATAVFWKNKRFIILDEYYLSSLSKNDQYWFYLFVLSHEIGHHLYGHMFEKSNLEKSRNEELQADRFAGLMIRKFNGNINNIKNALQSINHPKLNNTSHPILTDRLNAAYLGYNSAIEEEEKVLKKYNVITEKEYLIFQKTKQIANARLKGFDYSLNNTNNNLDEAIKLYNIAIIDYEDQDLYSELSSLYSIKNDLNNAELYIQKAYSINNNPEYLILGWDYCNDKNPNDCNKYNAQINKIAYDKIENPNILKILAKFYNNTSNNNSTTEKLLITAKNILETKGKLYEDENLLLSDIYNDLSVTYLRQENYIEAYACVNKAIQKKENLKNNYSEINKINEIDKLNYSHLYYNKALLEMRLEMWEDCLVSCNKLYQINPNYKNIINGDFYYFKGRCYHNLKKFNDAISQFNDAIKLGDNNSGYLYYYRGLSHFAIKNYENACSDFKIGCENKIESSCNRYENLCLNKKN